MNRFKIIKGNEDAFESLWKNRESYLDEVEGFLSFNLISLIYIKIYLRIRWVIYKSAKSLRCYGLALSATTDVSEKNSEQLQHEVFF